MEFNKEQRKLILDLLKADHDTGPDNKVNESIQDLLQSDFSDEGILATRQECERIAVDQAANPDS